MWCVDGIASVVGGDAFFDFSAEDAVLGAIILALGFAIFAVLFLLEKKTGEELNADSHGA